MTTSKTKQSIAIDYAVKLFKEGCQLGYIITFTSVDDCFDKTHSLSKRCKWEFQLDDQFRNIANGKYPDFRDLGIMKTTMDGTLHAVTIRYITGANVNNQTAISVISYDLIKEMRKIDKKKPIRDLGKLKPGLYNAQSNMGNIIVHKVELTDFEVYHQGYDELKKDIDFFFKNVPRFQRNNMPGIRRAALIGEPGTGKTSGALKIVSDYAKNSICIFCTGVDTLAIISSFKFKYKVFAIMEDIENCGNSSEFLNFLDGRLVKKSEKGMYVIFTSNRPQNIDPRIIKRPGRIDKVIKIGVLDHENAVRVANLYFEGKIKDSCKHFDGLTGAQIKELSNVYVQYCISNNLEFEEKYIPVVIKLMKDSFLEVDKMAQIENKLNKRNPVGFNYQPS